MSKEQPQSTRDVAGEQEPTVPAPAKKETKPIWSKEATEKGKEIADEISSLMTKINNLEDQGELKEATKLISQVKILLNQLESLRDEEKAKVRDRTRLIKWAREEAGKDEEWVDKTFVIQGNEIKVAGNLIIHGSTALKSLPDNLSVGGYLILHNCTTLEFLPPNLSVGGDFDLEGCTTLDSLPPNLSVGGDLILISCYALESLPDNLSVGRKLYLLPNAPESLKQKAKELKAAGKIKGDIIYL